MSVRQVFPRSRPDHSIEALTASSKTESRFEWPLAFISVCVIIAAPFLVGDQPTGPTSLNPVEMLATVSVNGDPNKQILLLAIYAACGVALVLKERPRAWLFLGAPHSLLLLLTFASALWSVDAEVSLRRSVALTGAVVIGIYVGLRLPVRRLILLVFLAGIAIIAFSLVLSVVSPIQGTDFDHRLRGVCSDKNHFAEVCALTLLTALALTGMGRGTKTEILLRVVGGVLAIIGMGLALSTAVIPVLGASLAVLGLGRVMLKASPKLLAMMPFAFGLLLLMLVIGVANSGAVAEMLGKDADISGRTLIWGFAFKHIAMRPFLGWGYSAFWTGGDSPGAVFWSNFHLGVPHSHNGYIQLTVDLGFIGMALFVAGMVLTVFKLIWMTIYLRQPGMPWAFGFLTLYLVVNYSEALLWVGNEPLMLLFIAMVVRTNVDYRRASLARKPSRPPMVGALA